MGESIIWLVATGAEEEKGVDNQLEEEAACAQLRESTGTDWRCLLYTSRCV